MATIATDPDPRVERATLEARLDDLKRRFNNAKHKLDVRAYLAANPWRAVAIGALAGVVFGLSGRRAKPRRAPPETTRGRIASAAIAGASALAMSFVREIAAAQLKALFEKWQSHGQADPAAPYAR